MMRRAALVLLLAVLPVLSACNGARPDALNAVSNGPTGFMIKTLVRDGRTRPYGLFVPENYSPTDKYPVIIFLHGLGEGGNNAHANLRVGLAPFVYDRRDNFPFICIFPQSPNGLWDADSQAADDVIAELDEVCRMYPAADRDRVSLTGLSTGGYGTYAIGAKYRDRFAALVPMGANAGDSRDAERLVGIPIRAYHNTFDMFAGAWNDASMVNDVNDLGGHASYTGYFALGHDCWEKAYGDGTLFDWLENQRRSTASAARDPAVVATPTAVRTAAAAPSRSAAAPERRAAVIPQAERPIIPDAPAAPGHRAVGAPPASSANSSALVPTPY